MITLKNEHLSIQVSEHGAELCSINCAGKEYLWQADPAFWKRHSPVLFPIVGSVWNSTFRTDGKEFPMSQHGFARDMDFTLLSATDAEVVYALDSTDATLERFPYAFRLEIGYRIEGKKVHVLWKVTNTDNKEIHFQIGAHPAFYYPTYDENPDRGYFAFQPTSRLNYIGLQEKGCVDAVKHYDVPVDEAGLLPLNIHTFDIDTYIIEDSQLTAVSILDLAKQPYLTVHFTAPVVGLWSPPTKNAPFVCIEPWYGRCDRAHYEGEYKDKDWTNHLAVGEVFEASYTIEIH
ncbi:MAG: aldose 1-epimerase family protein [Bacteroidaceae bacterium]|nr:aldose 1-epimerase family protein [Bacteroidaceae bacterium]